MINETAQLEIMRQQLALMEEALVSLQRDVLPRNKERYRLMAESYVGQIMDLRAKIDECLGLDGLASMRADLVITLEGPKVKLGEARSSIVTRTLDAFRRGLESIVELRIGPSEAPRTSGRRKQWIELLCDPPTRNSGW